MVTMRCPPPAFPTPSSLIDFSFFPYNAMQYYTTNGNLCRYLKGGEVSILPST